MSGRGARNKRHKKNDSKIETDVGGLAGRRVSVYSWPPAATHRLTAPLLYNAVAPSRHPRPQPWTSAPSTSTTSSTSPPSPWTAVRPRCRGRTRPASCRRGFREVLAVLAVERVWWEAMVMPSSSVSSKEMVVGGLEGEDLKGNSTARASASLRSIEYQVM